MRIDSELARLVARQMRADVVSDDAAWRQAIAELIPLATETPCLYRAGFDRLCAACARRALDADTVAALERVPLWRADEPVVRCDACHTAINPTRRGGMVVEKQREASTQCGTARLADGAVLYVSYRTVVGIREHADGPVVMPSSYPEDVKSKTTARHINLLVPARDREVVSLDRFVALANQHGVDVRRDGAPVDFGKE